MQFNWSGLGAYEQSETDVDAPWLMALESIGDATHLKFESEGNWEAPNSVLPGCGPDGVANLTMPDDQLVLSRCRFGALIGKIGGSSAGHNAPAQPSDSLAIDEPFAVGTFCLLKVPQDTSGPLFIGFNCVLRPVRVTTLKITILGARQTASGGEPSPA